MLWFVFIFLMVALDQITKLLITKNITLYSVNVVIDKFFYLTHYENKGVAFSLLENKRFIFIPCTIAVLIVMWFIFKKFNSKFLKISLLFISSGAIGNLIDRIAKGSVTDFIEFHFGSTISPIFNIADIYVILGALLLMYYFIFISNKNNPNDSNI